MRVAIVAEVFLPKIDGVVGRTVNLIRWLLHLGDDVLVVCPEADGATSFPARVVRFESFPCPAYPEYRVGLPSGRLVETIEDFNPDVIHYVNPLAFGFRCRDRLDKAGVRRPTLFSFHTLYGEFVKRYAWLRPLSNAIWWLARDYHNTADRNLTVSSIMQRELARRGFERVELWPPAVDGELFHPARRDEAMRRRLSNGCPDAPLFLTVSRLAPEKNVEFLAELIRRHPEARLAIVGDGPQRAVLERKFAGTNTTFLGYLSGFELAAAYASADLFLYASETETMGNVVVEAMASERVVVAPRAGGIPSLVTSGESGFLYEPGAVEAADQVIREMLARPDQRARVGQAARAAVESWGWRRAAEEVQRHYRETIAEFAERAEIPSRRRFAAPCVAQSLVATIRAVAAARQGLAGRKHRRPAASPAT